MEKISGTCGTERQAKHMNIIDAISSLSKSVGTLKVFCDEVKGVDPALNEKKPELPMPAPCLADVLNQSAESIMVQCDEIQRLVSELRAILF